MAKRETYWDLLRLYRKALYKSKLYWVSGCILLLGILFSISTISPLFTIGFLALGVLLLLISKWIVLGREVKR